MTLSMICGTLRNWREYSTEVGVILVGADRVTQTCWRETNRLNVDDDDDGPMHIIIGLIRNVARIILVVFTRCRAECL